MKILRGGSHYFLFYKILLKYIVDLQCCVNFCCTEGLTLLTILKFRLLSPYHQTIEEISTHILFFSFQHSYSSSYLLSLAYFSKSIAFMLLRLIVFNKSQSFLVLSLSPMQESNFHMYYFCIQFVQQSELVLFWSSVYFL